MEATKKKVVTSNPFDHIDLLDIYEYGEVTFGEKLASYFINDIYSSIERLETQYLLHPECRHLETKTKIYRNIIFGSYLIIYRIRANRIEVLRAFHGSRSPKIINQVRKVKIKLGHQHQNLLLCRNSFVVQIPHLQFGFNGFVNYTKFLLILLH